MCEFVLRKALTLPNVSQNAAENRIRADILLLASTRKRILHRRTSFLSCAVSQSVRKGAPMRDNNILTRHIKPTARKLGLDFVNFRCLRTSHATWLKMAGADVKDAQAQMRHSRASTTLDIYEQFVPESQRRVVNALSGLEARGCNDDFN